MACMFVTAASQYGRDTRGREGGADRKWTQGRTEVRVRSSCAHETARGAAYVYRRRSISSQVGGVVVMVNRLSR